MHGDDAPLTVLQREVAADVARLQHEIDEERKAAKGRHNAIKKRVTALEQRLTTISEVMEKHYRP